MQPRTVYDRHHVERKIREREATLQFRQLSPEAQDEMRERWRRELDVQIDREDRIAGLREESMVAGAGYFLLVFLGMVPFSWTGLIVYPLGGAVYGWLLHVTRAGRFRAFALGPPLFVVTTGSALVLGGHPGSPFTFLLVFFTSPVIGIMREFRGADRDPAGLRRRRARRWAREHEASGGAPRGGAAERMQPRADACIRPWGPAPEQGGDECPSASWTDWDLDAGDEVPER